MNFDGRFAFFPTPYPDEILYSILCRYHIRSGNPGATTTIREFWGRKGAAKSLYLPNELDMIAERLPAGTGITFDSLIWNNTMYPYVRPALTEQRADFIYDMLCGKEKDCRSTYQKAGLVGRRLDFPKYLRFCPVCVEADQKQYGEAYWHRLHQLPGVCICAAHKEYIYDSPFFVHMIFRDFFPAATDLCERIPKTKPFTAEMLEHHIDFAEDSAWILENGRELGTVEDLYEKHSRLISIKGYKKYASDTSQFDYRMLNQAIHAFYGIEFLKSLNEYNENDYSSWAASFMWKSKSNPPTAEHILMMRFLAGSPKQFMDSADDFLPFGEPSWPCHNKLCDYYLKDCIDKIEVKVVNGLHKAVFQCPHCGFSYRRGKSLPKTLQYDGQVRITDFGWLWKQRLKECLIDRKLSVHQTVLEMGYPDTTIRKYAVLLNLLPASRMPWKTPSYKSVKKKATVESPQSHRKRWLKLMIDNPDAKRSVLARIDYDNYKWLLQNDYEWFDANTPSPYRKIVDWSARDTEYLEKVKRTVSEIMSYEGKPIWLSYSTIANKAGIGNSIYSRLEKLPLTKQYLDSVVETRDEWRKRKILWAIQELYLSGEPVLYDRVRRAVGMSSRVYQRFKEYIGQEIQNILNKNQ